MDSYEWNKIAGWTLASVLLIASLNMLGDALVHPKTLKSPAYKVPGVEAAAPAGAKATATAATPAEPLAPLLAKASVETGEKAAKKCLTCHSFEKGGANKIGPNLWGVLGGNKARIQGFAYSEGMKGKGGAWGFEDLNAFLINPKEFVPGTKMVFAGVASAQERADILAYLRKQSDSPPPLPGG